jgi:hypothetical protein
VRYPGGVRTLATSLVPGGRVPLALERPLRQRSNMTRARHPRFAFATKNEILYSFNKPDDFILALVEFLDSESYRVHYLRRPFERSGVTTDFNGASVNFPFADLLARAEAPR